MSAQHPAVLAYSRSTTITVSPGQPGGAAQQAALQALHFAAVSDSVTSLEAGVPPLYRPGGAVATVAKPTVAGAHVSPRLPQHAQSTFATLTLCRPFVLVGISALPTCSAC